MIRRGLWLVLGLVVALGACTGVFFDKGNAFPCDFSKGPGARDAVCVSGDVCGTDNLCHPFIYEGPRFEGPATIPTFEDSEFVPLHPVTLDQPITQVVRKTEKEGAYVQVATGDWFEINALERVTHAPSWGTFKDAFAATLGTTDFIFGIDTNDQIVAQRRIGATLQIANIPTGLTARHVRGATDGPPRVPFEQPVVMRIDLNGDIDELTVGNDAGTPVALIWPIGTGYTGTPLDLAVLATGRLFTPIVTTSDGLFIGTNDGGFDLVTTRSSVARAKFRLNDANTMLVEQLGDDEIAAWFVDVDATKSYHLLSPAWPQCQPCRTDESIELATPVPPRLGFAVEVLCRSNENGARTLHRVEGAVGATGRQPCLSTELDFPLDEAQLATIPGPDGGPRLVAATTLEGVAAGGKHGELWRGETLSSVLPVALERVPTHVFELPILNDAPPLLGVLTDRYPAAATDDFKAGLPMGFRRINLSEGFGAAQDVRIIAPVRGAPGWVIENNGLLTRASVDDTTGDPLIEFGPHLTTAAGDDIRSSIGGEAYSQDGGLRALFVAADDGLYFVKDPEGPSLGDTFDLTPELIPEPSVPIRSLALERTPLGTDGLTRARGYLVTSRNVYEWKFGGTPPRWTSRPLNIAGGEPLEVWFDREKSALGRVGFSDGRIFTLPGGYQLAESIPGDDTETVSLIDYENFGGWPVALATTGLYVARWDTDARGKLQNHFPDGGLNRPMEWHEIVLPDGGRPWMKGDQTEGKLFVQDVPLDGGTHQFKLFVFTPNLVMQVGAYER